jgi:hypothetical protein
MTGDDMTAIQFTLNTEEFLDTLYNGVTWTLYSEQGEPVHLEYMDKTGYYIFFAPTRKTMTDREYWLFLMDVSAAVMIRHREENLKCYDSGT